MSSKQIKIAPSILTADFADLTGQVRLVEENGADWLHLDIMDGHFVPNITFGPPVVEKIRKITRLPLDAHLMIENPDDFLESFKAAGVDYLTVHVETGYHLHRTLQRIRDLGMKAGVSLNPSTPVESLELILPFVDLILIMTVNPGFGGQKFIEEMLEKIEKVDTLICQENRQIYLQVDGGIDERTIPEVVARGANVLVIGSAIYDQPDIGGALKKLRSISEQAI